MSYNPTLGEGTSNCVPSNVSGSNRHYYFSFQSSFPETRNTPYILDETPQSSVVSNHPPSSSKEPKYKNNESQTCDNIYESSKRIHNHLKTLNQKEQQIREKFDMKRKLHEENKKKQKASLVIPPVDKASMEAYKSFLKENEKKEFEIREQELKEHLDLKFEMVSKALTAKYKHNDLKQKNRIESIRNRAHNYANDKSRAAKNNATEMDEIRHQYHIKSKDQLKDDTSYKQINKSNSTNNTNENGRIRSSRKHMHHCKSLELLHSKFRQES